MARRLAEDGTRSVLLCEAGEDLRPETIPADIRASYPGTAYINSRYLWTGLKVTSIGSGHNHGPDVGIERAYAQARILGGGSSINGQMANWGVPADYDEWAALGAHGWGWEDTQPFFKKVERDLDFLTPRHGHDGPIPVRRIFPAQWNDHAIATAKAFEEFGYRYLPDQNGDFGDGYFPIVHANVDEERVTAATAYLDAATRAQPNLTIFTNTHVVGLTMENRRCNGVTVQREGQPQTISAGEVVLCAGAIHSPAILLRAGIGPGAHLMEIGQTVVSDLPGVGRNLMDHPQVALGAFLRPSARMNGQTGRHILMGLRYSSGIGDAPDGDMFAGCISRTAWHAVGKQLGSLVVWVNKTYSRDGEVRLRSKDWRDEPHVDFRLLSDPRDMARLVAGVRLMGKLHLTDAMRSVTSHPFPACYTDRARQVGVINTRNKMLTAIMAKLLDGPAPLRRLLLERFVMSAHDFESVMTDDDAAEAFVRETVAGIWHASCSCKMGDASDPMAVTDNQGRVHGIAGLRIADASVFPSVPSANTNFPVYMTAEKIAATMCAAQTA